MKLCRNEQERRAMLFSASTLALTALFWLSMLATRSGWIYSYFHPFDNDTSMDYFNMLALMKSGELYDFDASYPALPFLFWSIMLHFMKAPVLDDYANGFYLRVQMIAHLGYLLYTIISILVIWECIQVMVHGSKLQRILFAVALIFSGPMTFLLERGNILLSALMFLLLFMALYDSEDKRLRYLGYVCLSLSAAIKIYPAIFGLMVIKKKRYREAGILACMGFLAFVLPFYTFDGITTIQEWLRGMGAAIDYTLSRGYGINYSIPNLTRSVSKVIPLSDTLSKLTLIVFAVIAFFIFVSSKEEWKQWFALALMCVWIPSFSYTYTLVLLFLPIISCFGRDRPKTRFDDEYLTLFVITMIPMTLPILLRTASHNLPTSWGHLLGNAALLGIAALILIEGVLNGSIKMRKIRSLRQNGEAETAAVTRGQPAESNQDENRGDD